MRKAKVYVNGHAAGVLLELEKGKNYELRYDATYEGPSISLRLPVSKKIFTFKEFPPFFDGLLPEGAQLEALLRKRKIDAKDYFQQLLVVGADMVGAVSVGEAEDD